MLRVVLALAHVACAACGGAAAGPTPPAAPRPLTPADVGLPDEPPEEPRAEPRAAPREVATRPQLPPAPPAYYRRESCPPVGRCQVTREITDDSVRTSYSCGRGSGFRGGRALRSVRITELELEGGLDRDVVRRAFVRQDDAWKGCLAHTGTSARIQIRGTVAVSGAPITAEVTGADEPGAACLRDVISAARLPAASGPTLYALTLDYDVTSPATIPPLQCL